MEKKRPAQLEMPYSIVDVAAGGMHSVCLTQTGEVSTIMTFLNYVCYLQFLQPKFTILYMQLCNSLEAF